MIPRVAKLIRIHWLALVLTAAVTSLVPAMAAPNYFTRTWQVEQGLPQNKVTAVVQTQDGYLWVGTYKGLAQFDGVRFTVFDENNTPELHSSRITSLFAADDGTLWIGTESGDVSKCKNGLFANVPLHANWSGGKIYDISADDAGDVWLMNETGELLRVRDCEVLTPPAGLISEVVGLTRSENGQIWVNREGRVSLLTHGRLQQVGFGATTPETYPYVQGIAASRDGGLWVTSDGTIKKWRENSWVADLGAAPWGWNVVAHFAETSIGVLQGGTSIDGLWLLHASRTNTPAFHLDDKNGLPSDWVLSLWEDREKNLWCGTGAGLVVIRPSNLETISPPDKWKGRPVLSVLPVSDGTLWAGTEGAGLYRLHNGQWTSFNHDQGIRNTYVWSLAADDSGKLWAGTWGGGLYVQKDDSFDLGPGLDNFHPAIPALLFLSDGLWIGTTTGPMRYQNGKLEQFGKLSGKPFGDVRTMVQDKSGALWFGTAGSGLVRREKENFHRFNKSDGLSSDFIECLHYADDGALWIGTFGGGLNRFKNGTFSIVNREQGLPNGVIAHIEADDRGYFWMSSYGGILRASEKDLNRCADGESAQVPFLTYGISDGLPTLECSEGLQLAGGKTADGRLWFPTSKGLVAVDPAGVKLNPLAPPVRIEKMLLDEKKFADENTDGPLKIPPGRHRIEFEYTGLSFVAPEKVRFKCRLNNFETEWENVGTKRVTTFNYIPPGDYSFQVIACNNDGVWNESGASLNFEVMPYFWQTTWFKILGGLATVVVAGGLAWFDTRRRMRLQLERAERQRDIELERSRIARDIHDELGAQLTRITMMSESVRGDLANPERTASGLEKIYDTSRELTRSMDEIVWAVSPRHDTLESLVTYLEKFAQDWLATAGIRCRLDLPLHFPEWPLTSEVRHNVFLAFKEALHNAVKHSGASEVLIQLAVKEESFVLAVEDNGRGFAGNGKPEEISRSQDRTASGNGLENMRRRLAVIRGDCEIQSASCAGTKVVFSVQIKAPELEKPGG